MRIVSSVKQILHDPLVYHDPLGAYYERMARWQERNEDALPVPRYSITNDWRQKLEVSNDDLEKIAHLSLSVNATLSSRAIRPGPESYLYWNDGDPAFLQAIWCLVRRLGANKIVETGVAHGVTSRIILEALRGSGHLWSIDLPPRWAPEIHWQIGAAVGNCPSEQWSLIFGHSRRRLPKLLKSIAPIDLFVHDSHHSRYNMLFEMAQGWRALRPGGAMVVDDIDLNTAFDEFEKTVVGEKLICEAQPIRADTRRFNGKGLFGVLVKPEGTDDRHDKP